MEKKLTRKENFNVGNFKVKEKEVLKNEKAKRVVDVEIFDTSYDGAGVGKVGGKSGKVVFVPKALVGEIVRAEIVFENAKFCVGKVLEILKKSPLRIAAKCPYFEVCGGCDFQNVDRDEELKIKRLILQKELAKFEMGQNFLKFEEIEYATGERRFFYRNKIKFEVCGKKLGFFKAKTHDFFEVEFCPIASEKINFATKKVSEFLQENDFQNLKNVYIKEVDGLVEICLLFDKQMWQNREKIKKNAKNLQKFSDFLVFFAFGEILESDKTKIFPLQKEQFLQKNFGGFLAEISLAAFMQTNDEVAKLMYDFVLQFSKNKNVVNAYSGQGILTKMLAKEAKFVQAIEFQKSAHQSAQKLTKDLQNVQNFCGKAEELLPSILCGAQPMQSTQSAQATLNEKRSNLRCEKRAREDSNSAQLNCKKTLQQMEQNCLNRRDLQKSVEAVDLIVLDPPREGCKKQVFEAVKSAKTAQILYISCNFATLMRDLRLLQDEYFLFKLKLFDMFPCTANMEVVAVLQKK